ncbi:WD_REPEATS_REGION domain-containing protein, partial [Linnemannia schmuckeri]
HPDNTLQGECIQINHGHAATKSSKPPTIMKEFTTPHLEAANMPSPLGCKVIEQTTNSSVGRNSSDIESVPLTHSSMSSVNNRSSQCLGGNPNDKETLIISLSTQTPEPELDQVQEISKVEYDLRTLRSQRITDYSQPIYVAPMAKPSLRASDDILFPLMDKVKDFIASDCQVMLILGDSGAGKSTFNRQLEYVLWQEYSSGDRIPLFINLPALEQPETKLIHGQLKAYGFSKSRIQELEQRRQFTLICDGYDESQLRCNLHTTNLLNQSGKRDSKLIITCRSQYLGPDYRVSPKAQPTSQDYE